MKTNTPRTHFNGTVMACELREGNVIKVIGNVYHVVAVTAMGLDRVAVHVREDNPILMLNERWVVTLRD